MIIDKEDMKVESLNSEVENLASGWMLDSGTSRHITLTQNILTKFIFYCICVQIINGQKLWSVKNGNVFINIKGKTI